MKKSTITKDTSKKLIDKYMVGVIFSTVPYFLYEIKLGEYLMIT